MIEQEAGVDEYDSRDRPFIWSFTGGEQRFRSGLVDAYIDDDAAVLRDTVIALFARGVPAEHRSERHARFLDRLSRYDPREQATPEAVRRLYADAAEASGHTGAQPATAAPTALPGTTTETPR